MKDDTKRDNGSDNTGDILSLPVFDMAIFCKFWEENHPKLVIKKSRTLAEFVISS